MGKRLTNGTHSFIDWPNLSICFSKAVSKNASLHSKGTENRESFFPDFLLPMLKPVACVLSGAS